MDNYSVKKIEICDCCHNEIKYIGDNENDLISYGIRMCCNTHVLVGESHPLYYKNKYEGKIVSCFLL